MDIDTATVGSVYDDLARVVGLDAIGCTKHGPVKFATDCQDAVTNDFSIQSLDRLVPVIFVGRINLVEFWVAHGGLAISG